MVDINSASVEQLKPLKISCTNADCDSGLHCFRKSRSMAASEVGQCRYCGAELIDWDRLHNRNLKDANFTFQSLKYEMIRHHFWHKAIDQKAVNHARRKGRKTLQEATEHRLRKSVGPPITTFDGRQTGWNGNIIYYGQHALACCCRTCMEYWHGIDKGIALSEEQIDYFSNMIMMYIDERLPYLEEGGIYVPPIRPIADR